MKKVFRALHAKERISTLIRKKNFKARKNLTAKFFSHQSQKFAFFICATGKRLRVEIKLCEKTTRGSFTLKFRVENRLSASCSDWQMTQKVQSDKNFVSNLSGTSTLPYRSSIVHLVRKPSINFHVDVPLAFFRFYSKVSLVIKVC